MNLIHLTSQQNKRRNFDHPLLDECKDFTVEVIDGQIEFYIATRNKQAFDDLVLGNLILVKWVVGRYLHHWPESRPYEDDMASEGICAVTSIVAELHEVILVGQLRAMMVARIKHQIEEFLNNNRSLVRASLRTNRNRRKQGRELEYTNSVTLDEKLVYGSRDEGLVCVDILDSYDIIDSIDKEEFIDIVLLMMEKYPKVLESGSEQTKILIENIIRAIRGSTYG